MEIHLELALHVWVGEEECSGKASIYRGPILLTYDRRFNEMDPDDLPLLDARKLHGIRVKAQTWIEPILLLEVTAEDGRKVRLSDFGSAGDGEEGDGEFVGPTVAAQGVAGAVHGVGQTSSIP